MRALTFDLADAKMAAPPNIASISQKIEGEASAVEVALIGDVDVHSFREDKNYIIDVAFQQPEKMPALPPSGIGRPASAAPAQSHSASRAAVSRAAPAAPSRPCRAPAAPAAPAKPAEQRQRHGNPASFAADVGAVAQQAKIEIKPEAAPKPLPAAAEPPASRRCAKGSACASSGARRQR